MFQYAFGRHLAILNNAELFLDLSFIQNRIPLKDDYTFRNFDLDVFALTPVIATEADIPLYPRERSISNVWGRLRHLMRMRRRGFKYLKEFSLNGYDRLKFRPKMISRKGDLYIDGYWQSPKYFEDIEDVIRKDFVFANEIEDVSKELSCQIQETNSVAIHVRRTDFLKDKTLGHHGLEYFTEAVSKIVEMVSDPVFYVFSDDLGWCRDNIKMSYPCYYVGEEHNGYKNSNYLQLMTLCKSFIIPNSSYSWWGAYLSNAKDKIVIAPKNYFKNLDTTDLTPKDWIRI